MDITNIPPYVILLWIFIPIVLILTTILIISLIKKKQQRKEEKWIEDMRFKHKKPSETEIELRDKAENKIPNKPEEDEVMENFQNLSLEEQKKALAFINLLNDKK
jgi:hypothetical protein